MAAPVATERSGSRISSREICIPARAASATCLSVCSSKASFRATVTPFRDAAASPVRSSEADREISVWVEWSDLASSSLTDAIPLMPLALGKGSVLVAKTSGLDSGMGSEKMVPSEKVIRYVLHRRSIPSSVVTGKAKRILEDTLFCSIADFSLMALTPSPGVSS